MASNLLSLAVSGPTELHAPQNIAWPPPSQSISVLPQNGHGFSSLSIAASVCRQCCAGLQAIRVVLRHPFRTPAKLTGELAKCDILKRIPEHLDGGEVIRVAHISANLVFVEGRVESRIQLFLR